MKSHSPAVFRISACIVAGLFGAVSENHIRFLRTKLSGKSQMEVTHSVREAAGESKESSADAGFALLLGDILKNAENEPDVWKRLPLFRPAFEKAFRASPERAIRLVGELMRQWPELRNGGASAWDIAIALSVRGGLGCLSQAAELSGAAKTGVLPAAAGSANPNAAQMANTRARESNPGQWLADMLALKKEVGLSAVLVLSCESGALEAFTSRMDAADLNEIATHVDNKAVRNMLAVSFALSHDQSAMLLEAVPRENVDANSMRVAGVARWALVRQAPERAMEMIRAGRLNEDVRQSLLAALAAGAPPGYTPRPEDSDGLMPQEKALLACAALRGVPETNAQSEALAANALSAALSLDSGGEEAVRLVGRYFLDVSRDPPAGLKLGTAMPPGQLRDTFISDIVGSWVKTDVVGASAALAAAPPGTVPDSAISALVSEIYADPEAVFSWALQMQDPAVRASTVAAELERLGKRDPDAASRWAQILNSPASE